MWAFKASWLALVTWHPGRGHFSRCCDALDVPAPAMSFTLAVGALTTPTAGGSSRTERLGSCFQFSRASILLCNSSLSFLGTLPPPSTWSSPSPPSPPSSCRPSLLLLLSGDVSCSARRVCSHSLLHSSFQSQIELLLQFKLPGANLLRLHICFSLDPLLLLPSQSFLFYSLDLLLEQVHVKLVYLIAQPEPVAIDNLFLPESYCALLVPVSASPCPSSACPTCSCS